MRDFSFCIYKSLVAAPEKPKDEDKKDKKKEKKDKEKDKEKHSSKEESQQQSSEREQGKHDKEDKEEKDKKESTDDVSRIVFCKVYIISIGVVRLKRLAKFASWVVACINCRLND